MENEQDSYDGEQRSEWVLDFSEKGPAPKAGEGWAVVTYSDKPKQRAENAPDDDLPF